MSAAKPRATKRRPAPLPTGPTGEPLSVVLHYPTGAVRIFPAELEPDELVLAITALVAEAGRRALELVQALGPVTPDYNRLELAVRLLPSDLLAHLGQTFRDASDVSRAFERELARRQLADLLPSRGAP